MIKDIIIHVWGGRRKEPFGHTSYLSLQPRGAARQGGRSTLNDGVLRVLI